MVDVARTEFPEDMTRSLRSPTFSVESVATDAVERVLNYAKAEPVWFGVSAFALGFALGWRLKPW